MLPAAMTLALLLCQAPTLDNGLLRATLDTETGAWTVVDLETGATYSQPDTVRDQFSEGPELQVRRAPAGLALDGDLDDWADAEWVSVGDAARAALLWDDESLYAAFEVRDTSITGGEPGATDWSAVDHVAWWAGWDQIRYPALEGIERGYAWGDWQDWAEVTVAVAGDGYRVEARSPIDYFITLQPVTPGRLFRAALTVGDEEGGEAAYPPDVNLASRPTYAVAVLVGEGGETPTVPTPGNRPRDIAAPEPDAIEYTLAVERFESAIGEVRCLARLPEGARRLEFECRAVDGWEWDMTLMRGFLPEGDSEFIVPYYGNGLLVPTDHPAPPLDYLSVFGSLDMPGVGVVGDGGAALCVFESYDYLSASLETAIWPSRRALSLTVIGERDERGAPETYRFAWEFIPGGTAMDAALAMRSFCVDQGWWKTLREKRDENPGVGRLLGAPIVWGSSGEAFAREAAAAGVRRLHVPGSFSPGAIQAIVELGYLTGEYDNYVDADDQTAPIDGVPAVPDLIRRERGGELAKGWLTLDGLHQYYSLCSRYALPAAQAEITETLRTHPYNARFLDVHTAMGLAECYDENHPVTRTEDRENKTAMLQWIREQGVVLGGEHGRAWSVPVLDYQEGMMSCNPMFTWPAGHLVKVEREEQIGDLYLDWGLHPARRIPFWEMVFHGCVVSTWYWGDSVGYLEDVRPDLTDRKIAMTALYGSAPLMWATNLGIGFEGERKRRFLQVYNAICPLHEIVGWEQMVSFEYLTADRAIQRSRFSDGTEVTANFGDEPAAVTSAGEEWLLPPNGMVADGPGIHAHHLPGQETYAERADYRALVSHDGLRERGGLRTDGVLALATVEPGVVRVCAPLGAGGADLAEIAPDLVGQHARVIGLDQELRRTTYAAEILREGRFTVPAEGPRVWEIVHGDAAHGPDLGLALEPGALTGAIARVSIGNQGDERGSGTLRLYWDRVEDGRLAGEWAVEREAGESEPLDLTVADLRAVGRHTAVLVLDPASPELVAADNRLDFTVALEPDWSEWPFTVAVDAEWERAPGCFVAPVDLGQQPGAAEADLTAAVLVAGAGEGRARHLACQFEAESAGALRGRLVVSAAEAPVQDVPLRLVAPARDAGVLGPVGGRVDIEAGRVRGETYEAALLHGGLRDLRMLEPSGEPRAVIQRMIFSSAETGWGEDQGELLSSEILADGPVRTIVECATRLPGDVVVTRRYELHDRFFIVDASATALCGGLFNRLWYSTGGQYLDSAGARVEVDGRGDDEGVTEAADSPTWYAVRNDDWTHLCVALTEADGMSYWDATPALGQLGFTTSRTIGNRYLHWIGSGRLSDDRLQTLAGAIREPSLAGGINGMDAGEGL